MTTTCQACNSTLSTSMCESCGTAVPAESRTSFPPVSWREVQDHFVQRLSIDAEWSALEDECLTWWPWFLAQQISVDSAGVFDDSSGENWMRIRTRIAIATAPEEVALKLVAQANMDYPFGVFMYEDGCIFLGSTLALNPQCRGLLILLHHQALIQAAVAHKFALDHRDLEGFAPCVSLHPSSGLRQVPDELLSIYGGEEFSLELKPDFDVLMTEARRLVTGIMTSHGWSHGYSADEVDFYSARGFDVAVAVIPGTDLEARFGPGLMVMTGAIPPGLTFTLEEANFANHDVSLLDGSSQLCGVVTGPGAQSFGSHFRAYLPYGFLAEVGSSPASLAINIFNAVSHMATASARLRDEVLNLDDK